jgi:hypothetical protein
MAPAGAPERVATPRVSRIARISAVSKKSPNGAARVGHLWNLCSQKAPSSLGFCFAASRSAGRQASFWP